MKAFENPELEHLAMTQNPLTRAIIGNQGGGATLWGRVASYEILNGRLKILQI